MTPSRKESQSGILTIGHSTCSLADFVSLLRVHSVTLVADVRTVPRSRHNPQFNKETLPGALDASKIDYLHMKGLGGLRHPFENSGNAAWKNASFRGFADYMQSGEFASSLDELLDAAQRDQVVLMCAEVVPWRCHRSLIADALLVRGIRVRHILGETQVKEHVLTPWARVEGLKITYPAPQLKLRESLGELLRHGSKIGDPAD